MVVNDRGIFYALLVLIFWLPIPLGSNRIWSWSIMEFYAFSLMFLWIWKCADNFDFNYLTPFKPILIIFGIIQTWVLLQCLPLPINVIEVISPTIAEHYTSLNVSVATLSLDASRTEAQLLKGFAYVILLFMLFALVRDQARLKILCYIMLASGLFQALYGSMFVLTGSDALMFPDNRADGLATGSFIYKNHFANFLMMSISIGVGLLVAKLSSERYTKIKHKMMDLINTLFSLKALTRAGLVLMVIALVLSRSRMGNAAFFIALSFTCVFALAFMQNKTRSLVWLFGSMLVIDIFIVSNWFGLEKVQQRLAQTSVETETRDDVVLDGLELIKEFPITGTGSGSFISSFPTVKGEGHNQFYNFAHNEYLQFVIELGIPMTLLLGFVVLWSLWHAQYSLRKRRRSLLRGLGFACMMAIIGQLIHITVDFTLQPPANAVYFIYILGLAWISRYIRFDSKSEKKDRLII